MKLLSPVANPGKLIAAPVNYQKHLDEVKADAQIHANNPGAHRHDPDGRAVPQGDELADGRRGTVLRWSSQNDGPITKWSWP